MQQRQRGGAGTGDPARRLDPVDARQMDVHEDEIRLEGLDHLDCRLAGLGLADHLEAGRHRDDRPRRLAEGRLVVRDQDADDG